MRNPERDRRVSTNARRFAATASLAAAAVVGATVGSSPASASEPATAPATTPVATLAANHASVTAGHPVTFTVTERTNSGTDVSSAQAKFYVHTKKGWERFSTKTLSATGSAKFTFRPNYDHAYKVELSAVSVNGSKAYNAVTTSSVTVKAKPADIGPAIVTTAAKEKGKPYRYGADGPHSFDCSGLVKYVFKKFGIDLPHQSSAQMKHGSRIAKNDAKLGDLVFVRSGSGASHVAIYAGKGTWWEAPHTGADVRHVKIWTKNVEYRRVR